LLQREKKEFEGWWGQSVTIATNDFIGGAAMYCRAGERKDFLQVPFQAKKLGGSAA
jgi:hypothetical protein